MAMSGPKNMSVFEQYNLVTAEESRQINWKREGGRRTPWQTPSLNSNEKGNPDLPNSLVFSWCSERESNSHTRKGGGF